MVHTYIHVEWTCRSSHLHWSQEKNTGKSRADSIAYRENLSTLFSTGRVFLIDQELRRMLR